MYLLNGIKNFIISKFFYILLFFISLPLILLIILFILILNGRPIFHLSKRFGKNNKKFLMLKFRTMNLNTPDVATHLLKKADKYVNKFGSFLRKSSLDELPQIYNLLAGHMSIVGPRPALFNQKNLIKKRTKLGIHKILPGITGLAQISGRDNLNIDEKVKLDLYYLKNHSIYLDIKIIIKTILTIFVYKNISH
jgi:O-antigen biosynthesis protein WbqP